MNVSNRFTMPVAVSFDNQRGYYGHGMGDDYESTFR